MAAAAAGMSDNIGSSTIAASRSSQYHHFAESRSPRPRQPVMAVSAPRGMVAHRQSQPIVTAPSVEAAAASPPSSASSSSAGDEVAPEPGPNGSTGKKAPWKRPSNGPEPEAAGPVIGADTWPALSASSGKTSRKSSSESAKASSNGSSPVSETQGLGNAAPPSLHPSSERQLNSHSNVNSGAMATHQKSVKPNNQNTSSNDDAPQPPGPHNPLLDSQSSNPSPWVDNQRSGFVVENHGGNGHQQPQRNSFRSRSGSHYQSNGNRRDQDQTNQEWNSQRSFNHNRDPRMQQQRGYPRYGPRGPHPQPSAAPPGSFLAAPQPWYFGGPTMGYPEMPPPLYHVPFQPAMSFVPPMQPHVAYVPPQADPILRTMIINQINYYFSNDNLVKDTYLRRNMDEHGWVPVALIAGFNKMLQLTVDRQLILDAVRTSPVVEVQGEKLRRRNDWQRWIMPPDVRIPDASGAARSSGDSVSASLQTLSLDERARDTEAAKAETDAPTATLTDTRTCVVGYGEVDL